MKKSSFVKPFTCCLLLLAQILFSFQLTAQQPDPEDQGFHCLHTAAETSKSVSDNPPAWGKVEHATADFTAPNVDVVFDQQEGNSFLYETVAAWTGAQSGKAQVSVLVWVRNLQ
ncbi:MAG: hypothetical protein ABIQ93_02115, partial [Saprospiraceae bacterium]